MVDVSSDDAAVHVAEVFRILAEIGASGTPQILVLNKCDRLASSEIRALARIGGASHSAKVLAARLLSEAGHEINEPAVLVSGLTGQGISDLFAQIDTVLAFDTVETVTFCIPLAEGASIAMLHERGKVLAEAW